MTSQLQDNNIRAEIKGVGWFDNCPSAFIDEMVQYSQTLSLEKGQLLFLHEEEADRFFIIRHGWIKLFRETLDGTQAVIDVLEAGQAFGEAILFQQDIYPYSAESVESAQVISLPIFLLKKGMYAYPRMALSMLHSMAHLKELQDKELEHRAIQNAPQRIGCFLLRLVENQKMDTDVSIQLPYDKAVLASRLGMQPETFSRALKKLKNDTGIEITGATIKMDRLEQISEYSCAACSLEFPCKDRTSTP